MNLFEEGSTDNNAGADDDDDENQPLQDQELRQRKDDNNDHLQAEVTGGSGKIFGISVLYRDEMHKNCHLDLKI